MESGAEEAGELPSVRARHIKKRTLKNKALSVSFDEKDLSDFVNGFHKRKKRRRKEAQQKLEESQRRKRIEQRKKRKLEREFALYGGAPADASAELDGGDDSEQDGESDSVPLASGEGTATYDGGDVKVTVITSEISCEEQILNEKLQGALLRSVREDVKKHRNMPLHKKPFKKVTKNKSQKNQHNRKDRNGGKKKR